MLNALTVWNLILHTVYFLFALVLDFRNIATLTPGPFYRVVLSKVGLVWGRSSKAVHTLPGRSMWEQHRDRCFGLTFAMTNLVGTLFWALLFPSMHGQVYVFYSLSEDRFRYSYCFVSIQNDMGSLDSRRDVGQHLDRDARRSTRLPLEEA